MKVIRTSTVRVIIEPMTRAQARQIFPYRPFSKFAESRFGGGPGNSDKKLLRSGEAIRCKMCRAPTLIGFLAGGICPDCDGRYEYRDQINKFEASKKP